MYLAVVGVLVIGVVGLASFSVHSHPNKHFVIMDAGSTGTRIKIFTFVPDQTLRIRWRLVQNVDRKVKPGLSAYAANPRLAVQSLGSLIQLADKTLPQAAQKRSELMVRATAGLRLLKPAQQRAILLAVTRYVRSLDFKLPSVPVKILSGQNEAAYAWLAVNYVVNKLESLAQSVGTMEMGGGSTQITFYPRDREILPHNPNVHHFANLAGRNHVKLYARSYLNLGLKSGMFSNWRTTPYMGVGSYSGNTSSYVSPCLHPSYRQKQSFGPTTIEVRGDCTVAAADRFRRCYANSRNFVRRLRVDADPALRSTKFIATTSFFGVVRENRLVQKKGGAVLIGRIEEVAREKCANPPLRGKLAPVQCTALCHTLALLKEGFGMPASKSVLFYKKIDGVKPSWSLGCAIMELTRESL